MKFCPQSANKTDKEKKCLSLHSSFPILSCTPLEDRKCSTSPHFGGLSTYEHQVRISFSPACFHQSCHIFWDIKRTSSGTRRQSIQLITLQDSHTRSAKLKMLHFAPRLISSRLTLHVLYYPLRGTALF